MQIYLNNYHSHYEIEQFSRMIFKEVTVSFVNKNPKNINEDYIYINANKNKVFLILKTKEKSYFKFIKILDNEKDTNLLICKTAYNFYKIEYNANLAWGLLTGVRPVRFMRNLYNKDNNIKSAINVFADKYLVSDKKIKLCSDIFSIQKPIIDNVKNNDYSLYISIPFCPSRCSYCSFISTSSVNAQKLMQDYIDNLCKEIVYTAKIATKANLNLKTIYIGGGTPTAISEDQLRQVMQVVKNNFDLSKILEYTVEAGRADCTTYEKLKIIKEYGADRVSINPQTFSNEVLKTIGRKHTHEDFLECIQMAKDIGFKSINTDLIAGLPTDTLESFNNSLIGCANLGVENITVHALTLKRASNLVVENEQHTYNDITTMIESTSQLESYGYNPYYMYRQKSTLNNLENVGFSQKGHESLYNIYIMEEVQTIISCGAGGVSKVVSSKGDIKRIYNYKYPTEYINDFQTIIDRKNEVYNLCLQYGFQKD